MSRLRFVVRLALALAIAILGGACKGKPRPPSGGVGDGGSNRDGGPIPITTEAPLKDLGVQVVGWLNAGEYGKVRALFDNAMNHAVPSDAAVQKMWAGIEAKVGKFQQVIDATEAQERQYHVVLVTCRFALSPMDVRLVFDDERRLAGFFLVPTQNAKAVGARPQTPQPPFNYDVREVAYDNAQDKMHFAGTLTVPRGAGPFPAVLLVSGSGTQDRDETLFGHKPFFVLADRLTKNGIAVLRVDDPGAGGSTGDVANANIETHARDAEAGLAFLATQPGIDPKRLGLIGHSEGGIIAAVVGSRSKDAAFVVSLAGPGIPGGEISALQVEILLRADGKMTEAEIEARVASQRKLMRLVANDATDAELTAALREADTPTRKLTDQEIAVALATVKSPWVKSFAKLDPAVYWSKVTVPVLALIGDKDTQVPADVNLAAIKAALATAKNTDVETVKLAGLNHLFQPAKTGLVDEYAKIETTFDETALDHITKWLTAHMTSR